MRPPPRARYTNTNLPNPKFVKGIVDSVRNIRLGKKDGPYKTKTIGETFDDIPNMIRELRDLKKKK